VARIVTFSASGTFGSAILRSSSRICRSMSGSWGSGSASGAWSSLPGHRIAKATAGGMPSASQKATTDSGEGRRLPLAFRQR
jgi:hypothetical protein